jgi:3-hydroxymyristoyl/3-hydroxydecanoyl-(acyl carrier protein) dehydratase
MNGRFCAFSFVDQITSLEQGGAVRGNYDIPPSVNAFPSSLVAEAVGQLAAWAAMAAVDFSHRPVAGIAGRIELLCPVFPGQKLQLAAELESVDIETIGYHGTAHIGGSPVIRLLDCVGPMVRLDDFDEPESVRARCNLLRTSGATPGGFNGLPDLGLERLDGELAESASAVLQVPAEAAFFADHFPRRPVFPGTLLVHASMQTASMLAAELSSDNIVRWSPRTISNVKLRSFISPGDTLRLEARRTAHSGSSLSVVVESRMNQRLIGSAEIQFSSMGVP